MAEIIYEGPDGVVEEQYPDENVRIHVDTGLFQLSDETGSKYIPRERVYSWKLEAQEGNTSEELASYIH